MPSNCGRTIRRMLPLSSSFLAILMILGTSCAAQYDYYCAELEVEHSESEEALQGAGVSISYTSVWISNPPRSDPGITAIPHSGTVQVSIADFEEHRLCFIGRTSLFVYIPGEDAALQFHVHPDDVRRGGWLKQMGYGPLRGGRVRVRLTPLRKIENGPD